MRHGEAVAAGIICESWLSVQRGLLTEAELAEVQEVVKAAFSKISFITLETEAIAAYAVQDKKNRGTTINCTLLQGLGHGVFDQPISLAEIVASLQYYNHTEL